MLSAALSSMRVFELLFSPSVRNSTDPQLSSNWTSRLGLLTACLALAVCSGVAKASTYVVYIPLDSPIYAELETLDGLGYLDTYMDEIKPISRVEAARLTLEAERNMEEVQKSDPLAIRMTKTLDLQLSEEIGWLKNNAEDYQPTMIHPLQSAEAQYVYSDGSRRHWRFGPNGVINAHEATPLLPNNDGLPTRTGNNEIIRASGWAGFGGFLTGYASGAIAGPTSDNIQGVSRGQLLGTAVVASLGNMAISFGQEERWWGTGQFGALSQSDNAPPFYALTLQTIHPTYLPWFLRYLGPSRRQLFMGQLDGDRAKSQHPWIVGSVMAFKPLPYFEFGFTRAIIFGGRNNDHYNFGGFLGRFTGIATGKPSNGDTKSRGGIFVKFHIPELRDLQIYQEMLGSDNLAYEIPTIGHYMPFLNVSYQGGGYLPRLTEDGLTDFRFEWAVTSPGYSIQSNYSLYSTYEGNMYGDPIGPNATQVDIQFGRWLDGIRYKADVDFFYTEQAPSLYEGNVHFFYPANSTYYSYPVLTKEHSGGIAFDLSRLAEVAPLGSQHMLFDAKGRVAIEYVDRLNFGQPGSVRTMVSLSIGIDPLWKSIEWH
jgi:Capsule assembly protein Wzi